MAHAKLNREPPIVTSEQIEFFLTVFSGALSAGLFLLVAIWAIIAAKERKVEELEKTVERGGRDSRDDIDRLRRDFFELLKEGRTEQRESLKSFEGSLLARVTDFSIMQKNQMEASTGQIKALSTAIGTELSRMRVTVDEKLTDTLGKRIGESFAQVAGQLEKVHQGLGEMQTLATGVGDLKKALTNIKTRGVWGEVQLGALLGETLAASQYGANVAVKPGSAERVEFAVKLPGGAIEGDTPVWLPIDAKFPLESYQRLLAAQENGDRDGVEKAGKEMETQIKTEGKKIRTKYIAPPHTTDFAVMFLPSEGLYAEVLRRPGLFEFLQKEYRVTIAGPTTLAALLNSLHMGFRTLAIQERASEVWELLNNVKTEFEKFGAILDKTRKKLQEAAGAIDQMEVRSRAIERKLKVVDELPEIKSEPSEQAGE